MDTIKTARGPHAAPTESSRASVRTGIEPVDRRWGGFGPPGVHIVAGAAGSGKFLCVLHFLAEGLANGEPVALLTSRSPKKVIEEARQWGFEFADAWSRGDLRLLSFHADYQRRVLSAAVPSEVFQELDELLPAGMTRIGIDPGAIMLQTHAGSEPGARFMEWAESCEAAVLVTLSGDLDEGLHPAMEWVAQTAASVVALERLPSGLLQLWPRRLNPPPENAGPVTLEAVPGRGLAGSSGKLDRRRTDSPSTAVRKLFVLQLAEELPEEIVGWAGTRFETVVGDDMIDLVERFQRGEAYGQILVYLDRARVDEAVRACRLIGSSSKARIFLLSDDDLRSTDRVRALEAGAADVLSGHPSIVELEARIARSQIDEPKADPAGSSQASSAEDEPELLPWERFTGAVLGHLDSQAIFALVRVNAGRTAHESLGRILLEQLRHEAGDRVGVSEPGYAVLLMGVRREQAQAFLARVRASLPAAEGGEPGVAAEILSSVTDEARIRAVLGMTEPKTGTSDSAA